MKFLPLLIACGVLAGCQRSEPDAPAAPLPTLAVETAVVHHATQPQTQPVAGVVRPKDRAGIAARILGTVVTAHIAIGQAVTAGEVLVTLEGTEIAARLEQARATLAQAERDYAREHKLESKGAAAIETVRAAADRRRLALAAVAEAEALLAYTQITAPFNGVITGDFVNPGDLASPGQALFELEGTSHFRAEVLVPESLGALALGSPIEIVINDRTTTGRLVEFSPAADPGSRSRLAKIELPSEFAAHSGQFVRALWPAGELDALTVPMTSVSVLGQIERTYVVVAGRAQMRLVKLGQPFGDRVQVLSGLTAGETVIIDPPTHLRDGQLVEIKP